MTLNLDVATLSPDVVANVAPFNFFVFLTSADVTTLV